MGSGWIGDDFVCFCYRVLAYYLPIVGVDGARNLKRHPIFLGFFFCSVPPFQLPASFSPQ